MADKKQDIRITKTQRALVQALLSLLEGKPFSKITINDICQEALVSRSTFYAHFEDKYRLLQFCLRELARRVFTDFRDLDPRELLAMILENMKKNANPLRNLMSGELDVEMLEMFRQNFVEIFSRMLEERNLSHHISAPKAEVVASFYAAGVSHTIGLWIIKKFPLTAEELADTLCELLQWPGSALSQ